MRNCSFRYSPFLGVVWVRHRTLWWSLFPWFEHKTKKDTEEMKAGKQSVSSKPLFPKMLDSARHDLVGRSKPFTLGSSLKFPPFPCLKKSIAEISDTVVQNPSEKMPPKKNC